MQLGEWAAAAEQLPSLAQLPLPAPLEAAVLRWLRGAAARGDVQSAQLPLFLLQRGQLQEGAVASAAIDEALAAGAMSHPPQGSPLSTTFQPAIGTVLQCPQMSQVCEGECAIADGCRCRQLCGPSPVAGCRPVLATASSSSTWRGSAAIWWVGAARREGPGGRPSHSAAPRRRGCSVPAAAAACVPAGCPAPAPPACHAPHPGLLLCRLPLPCSCQVHVFQKHVTPSVACQSSPIQVRTARPCSQS